jgi:hypothetical protein
MPIWHLLMNLSSCPICSKCNDFSSSSPFIMESGSILWTLSMKVIGELIYSSPRSHQILYWANRNKGISSINQVDFDLGYLKDCHPTKWDTVKVICNMSMGRKGIITCLDRLQRVLLCQVGLLLNQLPIMLALLLLLPA